MRSNKWPLAVAAGAFTTAFIGGVALAGFQPFATSDTTTIGTPTSALADKDQPKDKMKAILDGLVAKGTITQAQEDAILQAFKDAAPPPKPNVKPGRPSGPNPMAFMGDLMKATSEYLGVDPKTLLPQLRGGKSLADITNATPGKNAAGLIAALTNAAPVPGWFPPRPMKARISRPDSRPSASNALIIGTGLPSPETAGVPGGASAGIRRAHLPTMERPT